MKKLASIMMSVLMVLSLLAVPNSIVYAANATISVSASTVNIGDSITVTVAVPDGVTASIDVSYPNDLVKFTNCSITGSDNGSAVSVTMGVYAPQSPKKATFTFSAIAAGTATFSATSIKAGDELGEEITLDGASASVTIENQVSVEQPVVLSSDNSLGILQISSGTLSPAFHPDTTNYKATVSYDVTKVSVSAVAAHEKAKISAVTGGTNLQVGDNTINVVVQAENGVSRTYTIVVTRQQKPATEEPNNSETSNSETTNTEGDNSQTTENKFTWNGTELKFADSIPNNVIPTDFEKSTKMMNNKEESVLDFKNGKLTAVYLSNKSGENSLYIYDENTQDVYPFVSLGDEENYVIVLRPDDATVPSGYTACTLSIEGKGVISAYQLNDDRTSRTERKDFLSLGAEVFYAAEASPNEFYLMYCMNSKGESGWYLYDIMEGTFQRYVGAFFGATGTTTPGVEGEDHNNTVATELEHAKKTQLYIVIAAAAIIVVLLIIIIVLAVKLANRSVDDEFEEDDYDEPEEDEMEIEFFEIPLEEEREQEEDEIEIEFFEIVEEEKPEEVVAEKRVITQIPDVDDEDDGDLEFIDLD